jgi:outer membrane protein TolC
MAQVRLEKDQLVLTRIIGLAPGQAITLTDAVRYVAAPERGLEQMLEESAAHRQDLKSAQARLDMAIAEVKAQRAERLPVIAMNAAYGGVGVTMGNLHETYSVSGTIRMPIFTGRRIESQIAEAQAQMERRRAEYEDLRARVGYDIRTAMLDLDAAQKNVAVATANLDLSKRGWKQASDRCEAGGSPSSELVTAQQAVAEAEDNYVASLYAHGMAKLALIRAMGTAEHDAITYLEGR